VKARKKLAVAMTAMFIAAVVGGIGAASAGASASYPSIINQDSPWAYWQLGESSGLQAQDSSGNGHTGTYAACVNLGQQGPIQNYSATAALLGVNQGCYMTYGIPATGPRAYYGNYSVEAWIKPSSTTKPIQAFFDSRAPDQTFRRCYFGRCSWRTISGEYSMDLGLTGSTDVHGRQLTADIGDGAHWLANPVVPFAFVAGRWYDIVLTVDYSNSTHDAKLFIDGQVVGDFTLATPVGTGWLPLLIDGNHPIVLGGDPRYPSPPNPYPDNFDGTIGQVAVYEYALSSVQVADHYSAR
jgi:hypothetical protein